MSEFLGKLIAPLRSGKASGPAKGQVQYDTDQDELYVWNGSRWVPLGDENATRYDTFTQSAAGTGELNWTHKPLIDRPDAILVLVVSNGEAEQVSSVLYGGIGMDKVATLKHSAGAEDGVIDAYFLNQNVTPGEQTVSVKVSGANSKRAVAYSMRAPQGKRLTCQKPVTLDSAGTKNLLVTQHMPLIGFEGLYFVAAHSGVDAIGATPKNITEDATNDYGVETAFWGHRDRTVEQSGSGLEVGWTAATEDEAGVMSIVVRPTIEKYDAKKWGLPNSYCGKGDIVQYIDTTAEVDWEFECVDPSAEFPWFLIGGQAMANEVTTEQTTTSTSYVNLATEGPFITLPFKGVYDITIASFQSNTTDNIHSRMSFAIGATAASDTDMIDTLAFGATFVVNYNNKPQRKKIESAAQKLVMKYKIAGGAGEGKWSNRYIAATPVRVV